MHSEKYLKELQRLHSKKSFGTAKNIPRGVQDIISKESLTSVLDFGCGKGKPFTQLQDAITVHNYDPVTSPIPLPNDADLVYSSDVLEHIEVDQLDQVIDKLYNIASKYQYHLIACHPAKKRLSDGRNAHLIIEKPEWWKAILEKKNKELGWEMISEESTDRMVSLKKGPDIRVIKYIVYMKKI
tara:strand:+ start:701 stop:1252 length:552 start_codon:yes stop_codon:yes gene_type:complete